MYSRSVSAPPVDKFNTEDEIELEDIQHNLYYNKGNFRDDVYNLQRPKLIFERNASLWLTETNDFILRAFSEQRTAVQMIDEDYPDSGSCSEFSGRSRTATPVGDKPVILPEMLQNTTSRMIIPICVTSVQKPESNPLINEIKTFHDTMGGEPVFDTKFMCIAVCKDQEGSRFIQGRLEAWSKDQINFFFHQIVDAAYDLSTNLFGNYVIQKIIPYLSEEDAFKLILQFFNKIFELSVHIYGCRVIQKLIDHLSDIKFIVAELENHIAELIESPNGNHVIQKCIDRDIDKGFIIKEFESDCIYLAQQRYGCRVLQRLFEVCKQNEIDSIYNKIIGNIDKLINDKYGNYVIQHLIQTENKKREEIFSFIISNSFELSKYKFSSNVIEKCVNSSTKAHLEAFLQQFIKSDDKKRPNLFYMCTDMYANYVVQRFFDVADNDIKNKAKAAIKPYLKEMKLIPFTKHILARLS